MVRIGLYGRDGSRLWVTTATEALYTWEWSAACDEISEGMAYRLCRNPVREATTPPVLVPLDGHKIQITLFKPSIQWFSLET